MKSVYIKLDSLKKVQEFSVMLQSHTGDFDLKSGKYTVDARSILGIFSLDTAGILELVIHEEDDMIMKDLEGYLYQAGKN